MDAQIYIYDPHAAAGSALTPLESAAKKPLRWAAWRPDGSSCLLAGNGGAAVRYVPGDKSPRWETIDTGTKHNLRGVAFAPAGDRALLVGNRGAVLLYEGGGSGNEGVVHELASPTTENLRRAAWHPDGDMALIIGNGGTVLRHADGALTPVPGDRAHTLRAIAWRPDGAYALVGAYASRWAGYPRPHSLYRCDGDYLQALLTSDDEDDFVAVDWHPDGRRALIAGDALTNGGSAHADASASNKLVIYDGAGFTYQTVDSAAPGGALLGAAWHPDGTHALLCGEGGALLTMTEDGVIERLDSGTTDNLVGPFWRPDGSSALLLRGPQKRTYTV